MLWLPLSRNGITLRAYALLRIAAARHMLALRAYGAAIFCRLRLLTPGHARRAR